MLSFSTNLVAQETYPDSVVWGTYCGECIRDCSSFNKINKNSLQEDKTDRLFELFPYNPINYSFKGVTASNDKFICISSDLI